MRKSGMSNVELNHGGAPCSVVTCTCERYGAVSHYEHRRNTSIARMIADLQNWQQRWPHWIRTR